MPSLGCNAQCLSIFTYSRKKQAKYVCPLIKKNKKNIMATIPPGTPFAAASGKIGDFVIRQVSGKAIIYSRRKQATKTPTKKQELNRSRFAAAVAHAKAIACNPQKARQYALTIPPGESVYLHALKDYLARNP